MPGYRAFLMSLLRRVVEGGDVFAADLLTGFPDYDSLGHDERAALAELRLWIEDCDIHMGETNYTRFKREWMRDRPAVLRDVGPGDTRR